MSTRMVENQRRAFIATAQDDARRLCASLVNLSDAQRAAILALIAAATSTPVDIGYWADQDDVRDIESVLDGVLTQSGNHSYLLGSGCLFTVVPAPGTENHGRA